MSQFGPSSLPAKPSLSDGHRRQLERDFQNFAEHGLPEDLPGYALDTYRVDLSGRYAGNPVKLAIGKGSGQLSMRIAQVEESARAGLGFVVLKTVIAQDADGSRSMGDWAIHAPKMLVEPIEGRSGATGWTVTWSGRGWSESFDAYLQLVEAAARIGSRVGMQVVPSVKYHLPRKGESAWRTSEYELTTRAILDAMERAGQTDRPSAIEKDFSPTLAGSDRASARSQILEWLSTVPLLMREAAGDRALRIGLKLFNAMDDDPFQVEMLESVHRQEHRPDFLIYANRLFNPTRTFEGVKGLAYGGPDLSDRNLRVLDQFRRRQSEESPIEISATGNIASGKIAAEYLLQGCQSFQIHTGFQLPFHAYPMSVGTKVERALHQLCFDPESGLIAWLLHLGSERGLARDGVVHLLDLADSALKNRENLG